MCGSPTYPSGEHDRALVSRRCRSAGAYAGNRFLRLRFGSMGRSTQRGPNSAPASALPSGPPSTLSNPVFAPRPQATVPSVRRPPYNGTNAGGEKVKHEKCGDSPNRESVPRASRLRWLSR